jgi:hypothetical protein
VVLSISQEKYKNHTKVKQRVLQICPVFEPIIFAIASEKNDYSSVSPLIFCSPFKLIRGFIFS